MFQSLLENSHSELLESFPKQNCLKVQNVTLKETAPLLAPGSFTADASPWWYPHITLIRVSQGPYNHLTTASWGRAAFLQVQVLEFLSRTQ